MSIVIDASVAVQWFVIEPQTRYARALRDDALRREITLLAPTLLLYEITSVLRRKTFDGHLALPDAQLALESILDIVTLRPTTQTLALRALEIATQINQKRAYDAQYIALAEAKGCDLWTTDEPLVKAARRAFPFVRWIGAFPLPTPPPPTAVDA